MTANARPVLPDRSIALKLLLALIVSAAIIALAYPLSQTDFSSEDTLRRWLCVLIGSVAVYAVYLATARNPAWQFGPRHVIFAVVGAAIYALLLYIGNTASIFSIPAASQVSLRPGIAVPIFFGYIFGPIPGFLTGLIGNVAGDLLSGFGVSAQWDVGNGLIGFVAGLVLLLPAGQKRQRGTWYVLGISAAMSIVVFILFMFNQTTPNQFIFSDTPIAVSTLLGLTPIIGIGLAIGIYFVLAFVNSEAATAVAWGALANLVGIGFAALADIYVNVYPPNVAIVGEFIPAAGPNMIVLAVLVPVAIVIYQGILAQQNRQVR